VSNVEYASTHHTWPVGLAGLRKGLLELGLFEKGLNLNGMLAVVCHSTDDDHPLRSNGATSTDILTASHGLSCC
jgi:hypothetical protein